MDFVAAAQSLDDEPTSIPLHARDAGLARGLAHKTTKIKVKNPRVIAANLFPAGAWVPRPYCYANVRYPFVYKDTSTLQITIYLWYEGRSRRRRAATSTAGCDSGAGSFTDR